ncbi:hypothetical protein [Arthrobacter woluwensis]|uniref:hypothetical protein n=1 Tax=Arthrobacter woluwensis TaxID=156980 RepID=UPI001AAFC9F5|nr:hypothetical protein [Arthrobacter woluwensis]QTF72407.1 hypothetical protein G8758_10625 [Arthrobacter woluwensis]
MSALGATEINHLWPEIPSGQPIALADQRGDRIVGHVDGMTHDRTTLWIQLDGGLGRRLVHHLDGYALES